MSDDKKRLKRILKCLNEGGPFGDIPSDVPVRVRLTKTDGGITDSVGTDGEDDTVWDPNGDEDGPLPCADTPFGCDGCPDGGEAGCYVDENGNIYMDLMVYINGFWISVLTTLLPNGILVGVYCVTGMGCNYLVIDRHDDGLYYGTEHMWSGSGNLFFTGVQVCNSEGCVITYMYTNDCTSTTCLNDISNWTPLYDTPHNYDDFEYFIWNGQEIPIGQQNTGLGISIDPIKGEVGATITFPFGGPDDLNLPYEVYQEMWVIWAAMWGNNPPAPWPAGWTPPDGQGGGGWG